MNTEELYHYSADDFHKIESGDTRQYAKAKTVTNEIGSANHATVQAKMDARNAAEKTRISNIISERVPSLHPQSMHTKAHALSAAKFLNMLKYSTKTLNPEFVDDIEKMVIRLEYLSKIQ